MAEWNTSGLLWIEAEAEPGRNVRAAVEDGIAMAQRLGCGVTLKFNGRRISLRPSSDPRRKSDEYLRSIGADPSLVD